MLVSDPPENVNIDILRPLSKTKSGSQYMLIMPSSYSELTHTIPTG